MENDKPMQRIGEILGSSPKREAIPVQRTTVSPEPVQETEEEKAERKESLRRALNISSWDNTFENLKPNRGMEASVAAFKDMADGKLRFLLCYGIAGCGKTRLCECLAIAMVKKNIRAGLREWGELVRQWKRMMRSEIHGQYDESFDSLRRAKWLIIDDVGMGGVGSNYEWGELEDIMRYRYRAVESGEDLYTVVTTNLDLKDLPDRVVSRFQDGIHGRIVLNEGQDYRLKKTRTA